MTKSIAFIPARSGSKRVHDKNIRLLNGHPLLAYSIDSALKSGVFDEVVCATDSELYAEIATYYGASVPFLRDKKLSGDNSPDIEWVKLFVDYYSNKVKKFDIFSILRPTSPFRKPETIIRAHQEFLSNQPADSLRAVQKCTEHPGKMWVINGKYMTPMLPLKNENIPWHSSQYISLPKIYVQNASLEIAWVDTLINSKSIAGEIILPFLTEGYEGFDINYPNDFYLAEIIAKEKNNVNLLSIEPFKS